MIIIFIEIIIQVMRQRQSGVDISKRHPFYFMLMVNQVSLVNQQKTGNGHKDFKFLLFKGLQIFNQTKDSVEVDFQKSSDKFGRVHLPKVELSFFIRDFKAEMNNDFIFIVKTINNAEETEKEIGNHTIFTNDLVDACRKNEKNKIANSIIFGDFKFQFVIFVDSNRFELEKIIKNYKEKRQEGKIEEIYEEVAAKQFQEENVRPYFSPKRSSRTNSIASPTLNRKSINASTVSSKNPISPLRPLTERKKIQDPIRKNGVMNRQSSQQNLQQAKKRPSEPTWRQQRISQVDPKKVAEQSLPVDHKQLEQKNKQIYIKIDEEIKIQEQAEKFETQKPIEQVNSKKFCEAEIQKAKQTEKEPETVEVNKEQPHKQPTITEMKREEPQKPAQQNEQKIENPIDSGQNQNEKLLKNSQNHSQTPKQDQNQVNQEQNPQKEESFLGKLQSKEIILSVQPQERVGESQMNGDDIEIMEGKSEPVICMEVQHKKIVSEIKQQANQPQELIAGIENVPERKTEQMNQKPIEIIEQYFDESAKIIGNPVLPEMFIKDKDQEEKEISVIEQTVPEPDSVIEEVQIIEMPNRYQQGAKTFAITPEQHYAQHPEQPIVLKSQQIYVNTQELVCPKLDENGVQISNQIQQPVQTLIQTPIQTVSQQPMQRKTQQPIQTVSQQAIDKSIEQIVVQQVKIGKTEQISMEDKAKNRRSSLNIKSFLFLVISFILILTAMTPTRKAPPKKTSQPLFPMVNQFVNSFF